MGIAKKNEAPPVQDESVNHQVDGASEQPSTAVSTRLNFDMTAPDEGPQIPVSITPPYLQIAHGISDLCNKMGFAPGSLVLGKENLIASPPKPNTTGEALKVIILKYQTYFKEYAYVKGVQSKVFATAAEAHAAGFTTEYNPITGQQASAPEAMTWLMLIEKPANVMCELFFLTVGEKQYAPAFFGVDKTSFRTVKDTFFINARVAAAGRGIKSLEWELRTRIHPLKNGNETWVPFIKRLRAIPEAELQEILKAAQTLSGRMPMEEASAPAQTAEERTAFPPKDIEATATEKSA
jgi:hypothetical protein